MKRVEVQVRVPLSDGTTIALAQLWLAEDDVEVGEAVVDVREVPLDPPPPPPDGEWRLLDWLGQRP